MISFVLHNEPMRLSLLFIVIYYSSFSFPFYRLKTDREMSWSSNPRSSESQVQYLSHHNYIFGGQIPQGFLQSLLVVFEPR